MSSLEWKKPSRSFISGNFSGCCGATCNTNWQQYLSSLQFFLWALGPHLYTEDTSIFLTLRGFERIKRSKQGEQEGDVIRQHKIFSLLLHMKLQHTSNQLVTASPAVQLYHRELRTLPRSGDRCWSHQSSPSSPWHCHTHSCELAHLWMCVSQVLRVFDFAIPRRELQLFSKVGRCNSCPARSRPVLTFNIFWTGSGGTFAYYQLLKFLFPFHPTNISPSQTQRVILYIVFEMYTHFSRRLFQGEQHTCRYFELAKEKEKDNATAENWSMTFLMFVFFFFCASKDSIVWRICLQSHSLPSLPFFPFHTPPPHLPPSCSSSLFSW